MWLLKLKTCDKKITKHIGIYESISEVVLRHMQMVSVETRAKICRR